MLNISQHIAPRILDKVYDQTYYMCYRPYIVNEFVVKLE